MVTHTSVDGMYLENVQSASGIRINPTCLFFILGGGDTHM